MAHGATKTNKFVVDDGLVDQATLRSKRMMKRAELIDSASRILFPFAFVVYNVYYWTYYWSSDWGLFSSSDGARVVFGVTRVLKTQWKSKIENRSRKNRNGTISIRLTKLMTPSLMIKWNFIVGVTGTRASTKQLQCHFSRDGVVSDIGSLLTIPLVWLPLNLMALRLWFWIPLRSWWKRALRYAKDLWKTDANAT